MNRPVTNNCNHPQLVSLPSALLRVEGNTIDIRVAGHPLSEVGSRQRAGGLSALVIGPQQELAARHARQTALQVWLPQAVSATLLLMGGFMFVLGFINRRESHLAYFGALSVGWALVDARLWVRSLPLGHSERGVPAVRDAGLHHLGSRAVPAALCRRAPACKVDVAAAGAVRAWWPSRLVLAGPHAAACGGQLLVRGAGAGSRGRGGVWHLRHQRRSPFGVWLMAADAQPR